MQLSAGNRLGPYEIIAPLGAGGMGEVYRARDTRLQREVAIKVLPEAATMDPEAMARFGREAMAVAALAHPNILALFDVGSEQGTTYAVTELLEGSTLRERLAAGPLPSPEVIDIARQMASGLTAMHDRGIVHRDLKPENVMVTPDGRVKILDFGLARFTIPSGSPDELSSTITSVTTPGTVMGTMGYMSPEQHLGRPVDQRADFFSFGLILHELLTGRRAFPGNTWAEVAAAILKDDPPPISDSARGVPTTLEAIVKRCLEKEPAARFASAREILDALKNIGGSVPASGRARPRHVHPWVYTLLPVIALAIFAVAVRRHPATRPSFEKSARPRAIAMLEFDNLTGDASFDWIGRGLPELLGTALARSRDLDVYDPQRLANLLEKTELSADLQSSMFERLKARGIGRAIVGSILRSGGDISIQCRVVDVEGGRILHADALSGPASDDLFLLAGGLIPKLQTWLEIDLVRAGAEDQWLRDITTTSSDAYRLYLRAHEAFIASRWREAVNYAGQSVGLDSQFVAARVDLVGGYWNLGDEVRVQENLSTLKAQRGQASPRDALQIDVIDAVVSMEPERVIQVASSARTIYPENRFFTYLLGRGYFTAGRFESCIEVLEPLVKERWGWSWTYVLASRAHQKLGHVEEALRCLETGMDVTDHNPEVAYEYATFLNENGDSAAARSVLFEAGRSPALAETPDYESVIRLELGRIYEARGIADSARFQYERVLAILPADDERVGTAREGLKRTTGGR